MYNALFVVLNNVGQVIAWQLTQSSSIDESSDLLSSLVERLHCNDRLPVSTVYVDNCCTTRNKLQEHFGSNVLVKLDLFHAAQRITRVLPKKHPLFQRILKDVKLLFRDPKDTAKCRSLPTPAPEVLANQLDSFITKWKVAKMGGSYILNAKASKELQLLRVHIVCGCLSDIPPSAGTNRNEQLHRCIKPFFSRCRMGIPLALALLTILFHHHKKVESVGPLDILSAQAANKSVSQHDGNNCPRFGIIRKTNVPNIDCWIFGPDMQHNLPEVDPSQLSEFNVSPDIEHIATLQDIASILQSAINLFQLSKNLQELSKYSLLLHHRMMPFMSSVSCLLEPENGGEYEPQQKRLLDIVSS